MTSTFNVGKAAGYEQLMGRWSKQLAPLFINSPGWQRENAFWTLDAARAA